MIEENNIFETCLFEINRTMTVHIAQDNNDIAEMTMLKLEGATDSELLNVLNQ
tara:strand:- start:7173 stop:7331 length:159 start_codon:yes stop_codon:yes gene_type:complete